MKEMGKLAMVAPISLVEISNVLWDINKEACPDIEGLGRMFYEMFWDHVKAPILEGFTKIWNTGWMLESFTKGLIYLIPKSDDVVARTNIKKWRPLTILNTIDKIHVTILVCRL